MATELGAADLLRSAARLVERALGKLDVTETTCPHCGITKYENKDETHAYRQLVDTPEKLIRWADVIDKLPAAIAARESRTIIDSRLKRGRRS